jgi:hypothetical protein
LKIQKFAHLSLLRLVSAELRRTAKMLGHALRQGAQKARGAGGLPGEYIAGMPSSQNAVDALPGWEQALPEHVGANAGPGAFTDDPRILWALEKFGSIEGCKILELCPREAHHTYLLERHGAALIHAIEPNKLAFLRCLVVKELLDLQHASFFLGDFTKWLEQSQEHYDLIIAPGVLDRMPTPVRWIELLAKACDAFYLSTHYASRGAALPEDSSPSTFIAAAAMQENHGLPIRLHKRNARGAWLSECGDAHHVPRWMEKEDILTLIRALGFAEIHIAHDEQAHPDGNSFSLFARRVG